MSFSAHLADYASFITNNAVAHNSIYRGKYLGSSVNCWTISSHFDWSIYRFIYWRLIGLLAAWTIELPHLIITTILVIRLAQVTT